VSTSGWRAAGDLLASVVSDTKFEGRFGKQDYVYMPGEDVYRCPAGEHLTWWYNRDAAGKVLRSYWTTKCQTCPIKPQRTPSPRYRINRWKHEDILDGMQRRLDQMPQAMRYRRQSVEHPFGTIKAWMGATHFLTKTLKRVRTEMSLQVIAYNMKRVVAIMGVRPLPEAIQRRGWTCESTPHSTDTSKP
jgi:transposase